MSMGGSFLLIGLILLLAVTSIVWSFRTRIQEVYKYRFVNVAGALVLVTIVCWGSFVNHVEPGHVGIVVNLIGNKKGVEGEERHVGLHFIPPWQQMYRFPIFMQNEIWDQKKRFYFQSDEGVTVEADVGISFILEPSKISNLFVLYRTGMEEITDVFLRNHVRDAINKFGGKMTVEQLYNGDLKEQFFKNVQESVQEELAHLGFKISKVYLIGSFIFPEKVRENFNEKINAIQIAQKTENEIRSTQANAQKAIALQQGESQALIIKAEADAKAMMMEAQAKSSANDLINKSLTPDLLRFESIRRWNGVLPTAMGGEIMMPFNPLGVK